MKVLKIIALGLLIWSLGLLWPELNLTLVLGVVVVAALLAGSIVLALLWRQNLDGTNHSHRGRPRHSSRPVHVA